MSLQSDYRYTVVYCRLSGNQAKEWSGDDWSRIFNLWTDGESIILPKYSKSNKKRNILIYFNTNYRTEMKLVQKIVELIEKRVSDLILCKENMIKH